MYIITCNGSQLLNGRYIDYGYTLTKAKAKNEVNAIGGGTIAIRKTHPNYSALTPRAIIEVKDEFGCVFRGRMTEDIADFDNFVEVDIESVLSFFNDSIVRPYTFPDDFKNDADYIAASTSGNVVEFYLGWLINQHNDQVEEFQQFTLGRVTVTDPNNVLTRSETEYPSTWKEIEDKLFKSNLGGYLIIEYHESGHNVIHYLAELDEANEQEIIYGENMTDLSRNALYQGVYSAIIPRGAEVERTEGDGNVYEGLYGTIEGGKTVKEHLTIKDYKDGDITDDIVKQGDMLYSKRAVAAYGVRIAPIDETTFDDVTILENLVNKGVEWLQGDATKVPTTFQCSAIDLNCTDSQVRSFRYGKKVRVKSPIHGDSLTTSTIDTDFDLTALENDFLDPQGTVLTAGKVIYTLTELQTQKEESEKKQYQYFATHEEVKKAFDETETIITLKTEEVIEAVEGQILLKVAGEYATQEYVEAQLALTVSLDESGNLQSAIHIGADMLTIDTTHFTLDGYGNIGATGGTIGALHIDGTGLKNIDASENITNGKITFVSSTENGTRSIELAKEGLKFGIYDSYSNKQYDGELGFAVQTIDSERIVGITLSSENVFFRKAYATPYISGDRSQIATKRDLQTLGIDGGKTGFFPVRLSESTTRYILVRNGVFVGVYGTMPTGYSAFDVQ